MTSPAFRARMMKETRMLENTPPPGVTAWRVDDKIDHWHATIRGPSDTPYEGGSFKVDVVVPKEYPFQPPRVQFLTSVYHPNIDTGGRTCLDTLTMPPKGSWNVSSNLSTVLSSIQQLLAYPNPDDGLVSEISAHFKTNRASFDQRAREMTKQHACRRAGEEAESSGGASVASSAAAAAVAASSSAAASPAAAHASTPATANPADASSPAAASDTHGGNKRTAEQAQLQDHSPQDSEQSGTKKPRTYEDPPPEAEQKETKATEQSSKDTPAAATERVHETQ